MNIRAIIALKLALLSLVLLMNKTWKFYIVQSSSMEPELKIGDLIVVKKQDDYQTGEVVTYKTNMDRVVTHRIDRAETPGQYITKGDANDVEDTEYVSRKQVIGKVVEKVPKLGSLAGFAKTSTGFMILILAPTGITMASQALVKRK